MDGEIQPIKGAAEKWSPQAERRLRQMVADMLPFSKILAEFSDYDANAVRTAFFWLFSSGRPPAERALDVLGGRACQSRRSATGFFLDGRPVALGRLVEEANRVLSSYGERLISYPVRGA